MNVTAQSTSQHRSAPHRTNATAPITMIIFIIIIIIIIIIVTIILIIISITIVIIIVRTSSSVGRHRRTMRLMLVGADVPPLTIRSPAACGQSPY